MNLKTSRITTDSGSGAVLTHILSGRDNEKIELISGSKDEAECAFGDAQAANKKYAVRHICISSLESLSPTQRDKIIERICNELKISENDIVLRVRHTKHRFEDSGDPEHEHILIREYNPVTRRVLDATWFKRNNEKLSREIEAELGLSITKGRHNRAAINRLEKEGKQTTNNGN